MNIGFDAKRVFFNRSGLGNYSRGVVELLARYYPGEHYTLFSPKKGNPAGFKTPKGVETLFPTSFAGRNFPSLWRSFGMSGDIRSHGIDIFHGLSNELPADILRSGAKSVVTIHDLIFIRFPELYKPADRRIYAHKYGMSCRRADRIIAISNQTGNDLTDLWNIPKEKIDVVYQGCSPIFYNMVSEEAKAAVRAKYGLPRNFILSVGTIEERKNLMLTVKAMVEGGIDTTLIALGRSPPYAAAVMEYAVKHGIGNRVRFIHNADFGDFPAIYQMADLLVYVSFYEGFGIPILEALNSGTPVITTCGGVFPETGGDACTYVDPYSVPQMAAALDQCLGDSALRSEMIRKGRAHALLFRDEKIAADIYAVYKKLF